jgi:hypothetical protein
LPANEALEWMAVGQRVDVDLREHNNAVVRAVEQHLPRVALDLRDALARELAELRHAHDVEAVSVERIDVIAVGLDEVGLVDTLLLVVRAGVIDAFLATAAVIRRGRASSVFESAAPLITLIDVGPELVFDHLLEIGLKLGATLVLHQLSRLREDVVVRAVEIIAGRDR